MASQYKIPPNVKVTVQSSDSFLNLTYPGPATFSYDIDNFRFDSGATTNSPAANTYYASPNGNGNGSFASPASLNFILNSKTSPAKPGDIIYLRGGVYVAPVSGATTNHEGWVFQATISGSQNLPITICSYPGEWACLDCGVGILFHMNTTPGLLINGSFLNFFNFEVMSSSTESRNSGADDSAFPLTISRCDGVYVYGRGIVLAGLVIHDLTAGISAWSSADQFAAVGNLCYSNGWESQQHFHGHGVYTQNALTSTLGKLFKWNIILNNYDKNFQAYGSSSAEASHYLIYGNWFINNQFLIGGRQGTTLSDDQIIGNTVYNSDLMLFYQPGNGYKDLVCQNNTVANGKVSIGGLWQTVQLDHNIFVIGSDGRNAVFAIGNPGDPAPKWLFDKNQYYTNSLNNASFDINGEGFKTFAQWKTRTGYDTNSTIIQGKPSKNVVSLNLNPYLSNQAILTILNWENLSSIIVDLSNLGWKVGDKIDIHSAQDYFGDVKTITLDNTFNINISMLSQDHTVCAPKGDVVRKPNIFPGAGAFVLRKS